MNKEKSMKILGLTALLSTTAYILLTKDNPESKSLEGVNINLDPERMVDNITSNITDQNVKRIIENIAKTSISKLLG